MPAALEPFAGGAPIVEEKVRYTLAVDHQCASTLDTDSGASQGIAHLGERAGPVLKRDGEVFHGRVRSYESTMQKILYRRYGTLH